MPAPTWADGGGGEGGEKKGNWGGVPQTVPHGVAEHTVYSTQYTVYTVYSGHSIHYTVSDSNRNRHCSECQVAGRVLVGLYHHREVRGRVHGRAEPSGQRGCRETRASEPQRLEPSMQAGSYSRHAISIRELQLAPGATPGTQTQNFNPGVALTLNLKSLDCYENPGATPRELVPGATHMNNKHTVSGVAGVENMERHKRNSIFNTGQRPATQT